MRAQNLLLVLVALIICALYVDAHVSTPFAVPSAQIEVSRLHPSHPQWVDHTRTWSSIPPQRHPARVPAPPALLAETERMRARRDVGPSALAPIQFIAYRRILELTHVHNDSVPGDVDAISKPTWTRTLDTDTVEDNYYHKQTSTIAHGSGPHMDAPDHVYVGARTIDEITVGEQTSPFVGINVTIQVLANPDYQVQISDFLAWEAVHGIMPNGSLVTMISGWSAFFYNEAMYRNYGPDGLEHWPGFSANATTWLMTYRPWVRGLATDTISIDAGTNFYYSAHYINMAANKLAVENLALMDSTIPLAGSTIVTSRIRKQGSPEIWTSAFIYAL